MQIFSNYFIAELDTLIQYYSRDHIAQIIANPNKRITNYHGKVKEVVIDGKKQKRLDFSGNGGKFRYFYDVEKTEYDGHLLNLNQKLEALYQLQLQLETKRMKNENSTDDMFPNFRIGAIQEKKGGKLLDCDGFELVRAELKRLKDYYANGDTLNMPTDALYKSMNNMLIEAVYNELDEVTKPGHVLQLGIKNADGTYTPNSVPS
uniref:Uncharacterized protein n=1 Tax=Dulem virus 42 TaxID=3145760 RepID=A0AAU8BAU9_9CAUD